MPSLKNDISVGVGLFPCFGSLRRWRTKGREGGS